MIMQVPGAIFWRRKDVLAMGITGWAFRMAVAKRKLKGTLLPWRKHAVYRRDRVMRAFGWRPCDAQGQPGDKMMCGCVEKANG